MPQRPILTPRTRRAIPVIALALVAMVVAGLFYLRPAPRLAVPLAAPSPTAPALPVGYQAVYEFVTPFIGWAVVTRDRTLASTFWMLRTDDAARHWVEQTSGSVGAGAQLDLKFFDRGHGYAVIGDGVVYTTANGGARWDRLALPVAAVADVTFADPLHGWLTARDAPSWKGPYGAAALYSTSDGGKSWRRLPDAPGQNAAFRNEEEGWAAATEYKTGAVFYSTVDGGQSWTRHDLPSPGAETEFGLFEMPQVRLLPGSGVIAVAGFAAFISVDGGLTWRQLGPMPSRAAYAEIVVQDATHWWTMPAGNLFQTSDGGRSWHHITLRVDEWSWFLGVIDARHAWARLEAPYPRNDPRVGSALAFTADAGKTWTYARVPQPFLNG